MKFYKPRRAVMGFLHIALPLISISLVVFAFIISSLDAYETARYYTLITDAFEHILMALLITVGGGVLLDIAIREKER